MAEIEYAEGVRENTRDPESRALRLRPTPDDVLTKSPNPSIAQQAASAKGDTKNALARWARWCSM